MLITRKRIGNFPLLYGESSRCCRCISHDWYTVMQQGTTKLNQHLCKHGTRRHTCGREYVRPHMYHLSYKTHTFTCCFFTHHYHMNLLGASSPYILPTHRNTLYLHVHANARTWIHTYIRTTFTATLSSFLSQPPPPSLPTSRMWTELGGRSERGTESRGPVYKFIV